MWSLRRVLLCLAVSVWVVAAVADDTCSAPVIVSRRHARFVPLNASYPGLRRVHESPPIYVVDDFLSAAECEQWRVASAGALTRSTLTLGVDAATSEARTSSSAVLPKRAWLAHRVALLTQWPADAQEPPQVSLYTRGQAYAPHYDHLDPCGPSRESLTHGGQRVATVLVYLATPRRGGATHFVELGLRVAPVEGSAVVFFPASTDGAVDGATYHEAEAAVDAKWVLQVWLRQRALAVSAVPKRDEIGRPRWLSEA